ncbi:hypothetical protein PFISCL1PPCAC_14857, partial [Pristionchus fissidentatus]
MRTQSIFFLLFILHSNSSVTSVDITELLENKIYNTLVKSTQRTKINSTAVKQRMKSFNTSVNVNGISYSFKPESLGYATFRHPEDIDYSSYNQSCLSNWRTKYNESVEECIENTVNSNEQQLCAYHFPNVDDCDIKDTRKWQCDYLSLFHNPGKMEGVVFPDGRRIVIVRWDCSGNLDCCSTGCCFTSPTPPPINIPRPTTVSP